MYSRVGRRAPLHCTALGKSLAAWEPEEWVERLVGRRLRAYTAATMTEPADLRRELAKIRVARYALDAEEFALGLKCVAAPLFDHSRRVVASLGIAGPAVRLSSERLSRLATLVRETAAGASRALGGELSA
jgi:IclR family acetate operon transcriptional repressor